LEILLVRAEQEFIGSHP